MGKIFEHWLSSYLNRSRTDIAKLLKDPLAIEFLITWSIYETKCFKGFCKVSDLENFSKNISFSSEYNANCMNDSVIYFYERYQNSKFKKNLLYSQKIPKFDEILQKPLDNLTEEEKIFVLSVTVYRYRNNIFHGNKGVTSWLAYKHQIKECATVMRYFIDLYE